MKVSDWHASTPTLTLPLDHEYKVRKEAARLMGRRRLSLVESQSSVRGNDFIKLKLRIRGIS